MKASNLQECTMSIATKGGDRGTTSLAGGKRVSKADHQVECYGTVDELIATLGFARSITSDREINQWTESIQRTLFKVGGSLATAEELREKAPLISNEDVDTLTELVYQIEAMDGVLSDWSLPGALTQSAAYEVSRTVCRRAERHVVRFMEDGGTVDPQIVVYLNRLSDLLWLFGRLLEVRAGVDSRLRQNDSNSWSKAW